MLKDEQLRRVAVANAGTAIGDMALELLAIRERAAQLKHVTMAWLMTNHGSCNAELASVAVKAADHVAYGDGAQATKPSCRRDDPLSCPSCAALGCEHRAGGCKWPSVQAPKPERRYYEEEEEEVRKVLEPILGIGDTNDVLRRLRGEERAP